jgi:hypothetical protein
VSLLNGKPTPAEAWGHHWIDCPDCHIGDVPEQDRFCAVGAPLRDAAVEDMLARVRNMTYGERV